MSQNRQPISRPLYASTAIRRPSQFITDAEYALLTKNAREPWMRALIAIAYSYGFRKGELLGLRVGQVDLFERWITLEAGATKNGEGRRVKMTEEVFKTMAACCRGKNPNDFVFTRGMEVGLSNRGRTGTIFALLRGSAGSFHRTRRAIGATSV